MIKKPKSKKGSSLVIVLLVFSILTILGTAMLSLTLMSYKRRTAEAKIKTNLYMSESGLAEAYAIVGKYVDKAFEEGSEEVENELADLLDEEKEKLKKGEGSEYIDDKGDVIESKIEAFQNQKFSSAYKNYLEDKLDDLKTDLKKEINYSEFKINSGTGEKPIIDVITDKSDSAFNYANELSLVLQSTFTLDDLKKTIQATYVIKVPQYSNASNSSSKIIRLTQNPVWTKAICADGDIKIENGTVDITGNIYVKGNEPTVTNKDVGIILSNKASKFVVTGNVATSKNLEITYNENLSTNPGSEIVVNGNIYAKNLLISKKAGEDYGAKGSRVTINHLDGSVSDGNLYVMDDMEVNAEKSTVNISGGFYGVSDGSQAANNTPDNSSSIIVNAEDIGEVDGSTINIDKEAYIAGSAYISGLKHGAENDYKYQTGESVSIKGNYRAYTQPLLNDHSIVSNGETIDLNKNVKFEYYEPLALAQKYRYFKTEEISVFIEDANAGASSLGVYFTANGKTNNATAKYYRLCYDISNNIWTEVTPLDLPVEIPRMIAGNTQMKLELLDENHNSLGLAMDTKALDYKELSVFDKSKYFKAYYDDYGTDSELNLGRGITIGDMANSIYIASLFSKDDHGNSGVLSYNYDDINEEHDRKILSKRNELKNQLFYMGYSADENYMEATNIMPSKDIDRVTTPQITVNRQVNFAADFFNDITKNRKGIIGNEVDTSKEIILLNGDENKGYAFISEGADEGGIPNTHIEKIYYKPSTTTTSFKGIIVTKGDLYIAGNINFAGTIICGGTIYFTDATEKKFTYDESYVKNQLTNNYSIFKDVFVNPLSSKNDIYLDVFEGERSFVQSSMLQMKEWVIIK